MTTPKHVRPLVEQLAMFCTLAAERGPWRIYDSALRNAHGECPICAAVNTLMGSQGWTLAAHYAVADLIDDDRLHSDASYYELRVAISIVLNAADGRDDARPLTGAVRRALIETLGATPA